MSLPANRKKQMKGIMKNSIKLRKVFDIHATDFSISDDVFNATTKAVLPTKKADEFLQHKQIGEDLYKVFKDERVNGEKSIWEKMTKRKLPTFVASNKTTHVQLKEKVVELKEEKRLMTQFIVASRSREDIDLPHIFGNHEFSVVPRSMFSTDGCLLLGSDKSTVLHRIEEMTSNEDESLESNAKQQGSNL